jgi:peptidoglycan hydrolase-like protein with peptidoglycan-binding domain
MRLPLIAASLAFVCVFSAGMAAPRAAANQATSSSASSTTSKPTTHKKKHHYTKRQPTQKAPTADRISEIQSALAREGYYQGDPNGKWDAGTVAAVQKFQSANGIDSTGKLDAPTLQKLGLGSDTAGISAPKPVPAPGCCSSTPASPPSSENVAPVSNSAIAQNSPTPASSGAATVTAKSAEH